jgi:hypothetical protein
MPVKIAGQIIQNLDVSTSQPLALTDPYQIHVCNQSDPAISCDSVSVGSLTIEEVVEEMKHCLDAV